MSIMPSFRDFRIAARSLSRVGSLWVAVALTLALGIGANAAIFLGGAERPLAPAGQS